MKNEFQFLHSIKETLEKSEESRKIRAEKLSSLKFKKVAFDTRLFDPTLDSNPRPSVQNYRPSQPKLSKELSDKLFQLKRLYDITEIIKSQFQREPEYLESLSRSLNEQLKRVLRLEQKDSEFSENQQALSSVSYVQELIFARYRLTFDDLKEMSDKQIMDRILTIDEKLLNLNPMVNPPEYKISQQDKVAYNDILSKVLQNPSDKDKIITIKVSDKDEPKDEFKNALSSLKTELINIKNSMVLEKDEKSEFQKTIASLNSEIKSLKEDIKNIPSTNFISASTSNTIKKSISYSDDDDDLLEALAQLEIMQERENNV